MLQLPSPPPFGKDCLALVGGRWAVSEPAGVRPQNLQMAVGGDSGPRDSRTWVAGDLGFGSLGPLCSGDRALGCTDLVWSWIHSLRRVGAGTAGSSSSSLGTAHSPLFPHPHPVQVRKLRLERKGVCQSWTLPFQGTVPFTLGPSGIGWRWPCSGCSFLGRYLVCQLLTWTGPSLYFVPPWFHFFFSAFPS